MGCDVRRPSDTDRRLVKRPDPPLKRRSGIPDAMPVLAWDVNWWRQAFARENKGVGAGHTAVRMVRVSQAPVVERQYCQLPTIMRLTGRVQVLNGDVPKVRERVDGPAVVSVSTHPKASLGPATLALVHVPQVERVHVQAASGDIVDERLVHARARCVNKVLAVVVFVRIAVIYKWNRSDAKLPPVVC